MDLHGGWSPTFRGARKGVAGLESQNATNLQSPEALSKREKRKSIVMTELEILRGYIKSETGYEGDLDPNLDLLEEQILDSFSIVQWAMFIQERFRIDLEAEELVRDNLSSLSRVIALIDSKRSAIVGQDEKPS